MRVWVHLDVTRDLRSSGLAVLGAGGCPSVHDKSLLSTALFPLTTKEKMEADQRSIYVGNVSGSPCSVPSWVCVPNPWCGSAPPQSLAVPIPGVSPVPSPAWEHGSLSSTCSSPVAVSASQKPPGSCGLCGIPCSFKTGQVVCWICVPGGSTQSWEGPLTLSRG